MKGFAARAGRGVEAVLVTRIRAVAQQIEHIDRLAGGNRALGGVEGLQGDFDGVHWTSRGFQRRGLRADTPHLATRERLL
jgi:hypothetical protein